MNCSLCKKVVKDEADLVRLMTSVQLQTLAFLSGQILSDETTSPQFVCLENCNPKIEMVSGLQRKFSQGSKEVKSEEEKTFLEEESSEEIAELTEFYTENEVENDPEYKPGRMGTTRMSARNKLSTSKSFATPTSDECYLKCQLCHVTSRRVSSLRRHYMAQHGYDLVLGVLNVEEGVKQEGQGEKDEARETLSCLECSQLFCDLHVYVAHVLLNHVGSQRPVFKCQNCDKAYGHEKELKVHQERLCKMVRDKYKECKHCKKIYVSSHIKTHEEYVHKCRFCPITLETRKEKLSHLKESHYNEMTDICGECGGRFENAKCLQRHQRMIHSMNFVQCSRLNCYENFVRGSGRLKKHLKKFHDPKEEALRATYKYECKECHRKIRLKSLLRSHMMVKHNATGRKATCPYCNFTVPMKRRNDIYRQHLPKAHPEQKEAIESERLRLAKKKEDLQLRAKVQCFLCSYAGTLAQNMSRHYMEVHGFDRDEADRDEPDPENVDGSLCPECGEHFANKHVLIKHLLKVHSRSVGVQCLYCNNRYRDMNLCNLHIDKFHQVEKRAEVQFCKKCMPEQRFPSFEELLRHTRSYHRKIVKHIVTPSSSSTGMGDPSKNRRLCENCGKTVAAKFMGRHRSECMIGLDKGESKAKRCPIHLSGTCPFCEKRFSDILQHLRLGHAEEKKSENCTVCQLCNKKFNSIRELVSHRQLHPNFNMHMCNKCKQTNFETFRDLRNHQKESCPKKKKKRKKEITTAVSDVTEPTASISATSAILVNSESTAACQSASGTTTKPKPVEYEGRGTVNCHICQKSFTLKVLLRRHFVSHHNFKPEHVAEGELDEKVCETCNERCYNQHAWIKHQLDHHTQISGEVCPYCDCKWGAKKFDDLDDHVSKHHFWETQFPVQECTSCKCQFGSYDELRQHRQLHDRKNVELKDPSDGGSSTIVVHSRVGAIADIGNRGGVKCLLCNAFKLRKDHLKTHYVKHHGYDPKQAVDNDVGANKLEGNEKVTAEDGEEEDLSELVPCPSCHKPFRTNHHLIKHMLKIHCNYTGLICPYCKSHHPERYIDLHGHVIKVHIDKLTGYNVDNTCKVCKKKFSGYAELRDHVQIHGNAYREPYGNQDSYKENKKRRKLSSQIGVSVTTTAQSVLPMGTDHEADETQSTLGNALLTEIFTGNTEEAGVDQNGLALEECGGNLLLTDCDEVPKKNEVNCDLFSDFSIHPNLP